MKSFKLILLSINLLMVNSQFENSQFGNTPVENPQFGNSQSISRDCPSLNTFLNLPQENECCITNDTFQCDSDGYLTHVSIYGQLQKERVNFNNFPLFSRIKMINAPNNYIENIPKTIINSSTLEILKLNENNIKFLPNNLFDSFINLKELEFGNNLIENIPSTINKLKNLVYLNICYNNLKSLPESLFDLPSLNFINLDQNSELKLLINRSPSKTIIDTCSIKGVNVVCYEPGSCKKLVISNNENITDEQAKKKYITCTEYNNNLNNNSNSTSISTANPNANSTSNSNPSNSNLNSNANSNSNSNSNSNLYQILVKIGIALGFITLIIICTLLFIKYKKIKKADVIIYEKHNMDDISTNNNNNNNESASPSSNTPNQSNQIHSEAHIKKLAELNNNNEYQLPPPYSLMN